MKARHLEASDWLWKEETGYYAEKPADLVRRPILPDPRRLRDRRIAALFAAHAGVRPGEAALEIGCGRSPWLPHLANVLGCRVSGIDIEPHAAALARANLEGAGAAGTIVCADAFAPAAVDRLRGRFDLVYSMGVLEHYADPSDRLRILAAYLRPGGRILTTVPNMRWVNWLLQRFADRRTLRAHVVYDPPGLMRVHAAAGLTPLGCGHAGFCDGHLSSAAGATSRVRRRLHRAACRALGRAAEGWLRVFGDRAAPETAALSPHVWCVARRTDR